MYATDLLGYDCLSCTAQQKVSRGCEKDAPEQYRLEISGQVHRRCPRRPILEDPYTYQELFWLYRQKEKGYLTDRGGLDDQPAVLMESFRIIDATLANVAAHKKDEQDRKSRRAARTKANGPGKPSRRGRRR